MKHRAALALALALIAAVLAILPGCPANPNPGCPLQGQQSYECTLSLARSDSMGMYCHGQHTLLPFCAWSADDASNQAETQAQAQGGLPPDLHVILRPSCSPYGPKYMAQALPCDAASDNPCIGCAKRSCCTEFTACSSDKNCSCIAACLAMSPVSNACVSACGTAGPVASALAQCFQQSCVSACNAGPGPGSMPMTCSEMDAGAPDPCAPSPTDVACEACAKSNCCPMVTACVPDAACTAFNACMVAGSTVEACSVKLGKPDGPTTALVQCAQGPCAGVCNWTTNGAGGGSP